MFGSLGKNTVDHKKSILEILNDDRWTPAQKAAYCFDHGVCDKCGVKVCFVGPFKRRPYTNELVLNGVCRTCYPEKCQQEQPSPSPQQPNGASPTTKSKGQVLPAWGQKFVVPPDVLLAKTTDALSSLQTNVKDGIHRVNGTITSSSEQQQRLIQQTKTGVVNLHSSVRVGISNLNENIKNKSDAIGTSSSRLNTNNNSIQSPQQQQQRSSSHNNKTALSNLKYNFQASNIIDDQTLQGRVQSTIDSNNQSRHADSQIIEKAQATEEAAMKGRVVTTPFGKGMIVDHRKEDDIYVIHLQQNLAFTTTDGIATIINSGENAPSKNRNTKLFCKKESFTVEDENNKTRQKQSMEINEAYESLEKMRRLNLELECQERGVATVDYSSCTICLLNSGTQQQQQQQRPQKFPLIRKLMQDHQKSKAAAPCLFCAAPTCPAHSCPTFRKEGITACVECVKLFEPDYIVDCVKHAHGLASDMADEDKTREHRVDHMIDCYDRVLLLLKYSSQYIESIAAALEENTKKSNNVNVGSSSAGIMSGALGVAAAAAIFTPAGPPLLVASLLLGGGATAVQTGTEVVNYFSEPNKFADKIIALTGMVHQLLRVKETLREVLTARLLKEQGNPDIDRLKKSLEVLHENQRSAALKVGTTMASTAVLGGVAMGAAEVAAIGAVEVAAGAATVESAAIMSAVETGALAGRNANMLSKGGTAIARGARLARFAGGALSAATLVLEARTMSSTIKQIRAGHPCEKADALRAILKELPTLPTSEQLDEECRIYIGASANICNSTSLMEAIKLIESKAIAEWQITKASMQESEITTKGEGMDEVAPAGASILDGNDSEDNFDNTVEADDDLALWESSLKVAQKERMAQSTSGLPEPVVSGLVNNGEEQGAHILAPDRMTQSLTQLPCTTSPMSAESQQSSLLERIQKFKQQGDTGTSDHMAANGSSESTQTATAAAAATTATAHE